MDFNKSLVFGGLTNKVPTPAEIEEAKKAARLLQNANVFEFDFSNDTAFMTSVAKFANSFRW